MIIKTHEYVLHRIFFIIIKCFPTCVCFYNIYKNEVVRIQRYQYFGIFETLSTPYDIISFQYSYHFSLFFYISINAQKFFLLLCFFSFYVFSVVVIVNIILFSYFPDSNKENRLMKYQNYAWKFPQKRNICVYASTIG